MKKIIYILSSLLFLSQVALAQNAPQILHLQSDRETYQLGQKAVLLAHVTIAPTNPSYETVLTAKFDGHNIAMMALTADEWSSITPTFDQTSSFTWKVSAYVQDKVQAHELEGAISYYQQKIANAEQQLVTVTDPEFIEQLNRVIDDSQDIISDLEDQLNDLRILVETQQMSVVVSA